MKRKNKKEEKNKKEAYSISDVNHSNQEKSIFSTESEGGKFIIIILVIIAFIALLWIVNILKNDSGEKKQTTEVTTQYEEIVIGNMLNQKYDDYYVIAYEEEYNMKDLIEYLISRVSASSKSFHSYKIDLTEAYNLPAVSTESYFKGTDLSKIKFKETTLLKISKGKIVNSYEGKEAITKHLKSLIKTEG